MKSFNLGLLVLIICLGCQQTTFQNTVVTADIDNFWIAYDSITQTEDSLQQVNYLNQLYLKKATPGLNALQQVRNYTTTDYLNAIKQYPKFWKAIRSNTLEAKKLKIPLNKGIEKLGEIIPLKNAQIYFAIGALRTNGTTLDSLVLIGSELALANEHIPTEEIALNFSHLPSYFKSNPGKNIVFLNIHEYIHTQQKTTIGNHLLAQTVIEGVAEFVAEKALEINSPNPQIAYGKQHDLAIKSAFEKEMYSPMVYNWIWNSPNNTFGMRDLAYYVGYAICEAYYNKASDKNKALQDMIYLDYNNPEELNAFVENSAYFEKPLSVYQQAFEKSRPFVIKSLTNDVSSKNTVINNTLDTIKVQFSQPMDIRYRNFELGPLGKEAQLYFKEIIGFSKDSLSFSFIPQTLEADKNYQIEFGYGFRNINGIPLKPFLIDFKTSKTYE